MRRGREEGEINKNMEEKWTRRKENRDFKERGTERIEK
jgi:hypothetical protein